MNGHGLWLGAYGGLWKLARPLLRYHKRLREGFGERLAPEGWPYVAKAQAEGGAQAGRFFDLWIQAASGGEAYLALELLGGIADAGLAGAARTLRVLCTSCTAQGLDVLRKAQAALRGMGLDVVVNSLPLDEPGIMRRAVELVFDGGGKGCLALLETEIWPGLLSACKEAGVPVLVLNGRMNEGSRRAYALLRGFLRANAPAEILATTEADLDRFRAVFGSADENDRGKTVFSLMRNIKFDRMRLPDEAGGAEERGGLSGLFDAARPCRLVVFGSVRKEEAEQLLPVLPRLLAEDGTVCLAFVPRHLHLLDFWLASLEKAGLAPVLRSGLIEPGAADAGSGREAGFASGRVLLWDVFGELDALYAAADAVFVGGSLADLGGQNFLEPLAHGTIPCIGRSWSNFLWVGEEIFSAGLVRRVNDADGLAAALLEQLREPRDREEVLRRFMEYLKLRQGGTAQAVRALERHIGSFDS